MARRPEHSCATLALLVAQGLLAQSRQLPVHAQARKQWLQGLATDALDLTRPQQVHSLDLAMAFGAKPLEQSDPQFLLAHRDWLELVPAHERPKLKVQARQRNEFSSAMAGLESVCMPGQREFSATTRRNVANLGRWVHPWVQQELSSEAADLAAFLTAFSST